MAFVRHVVGLPVWHTLRRLADSRHSTGRVNVATDSKQWYAGSSDVVSKALERQAGQLGDYHAISFAWQEPHLTDWRCTNKSATKSKERCCLEVL